MGLPSAIACVEEAPSEEQFGKQFKRWCRRSRIQQGDIRLAEKHRFMRVQWSCEVKNEGDDLEETIYDDGRNEE